MTSGVVAAVDLGASSGRVIIGRVGPDRLDIEEVHRFANGAHRGTAMTPSQVQEVVHDWATGGSGHAMAPLSCRSNADWRLEGVTAWGDPVQLASVCGLFTDDNGTFWHPSPSVQQLLTTLEARAA